MKKIYLKKVFIGTTIALVLSLVLLLILTLLAYYTDITDGTVSILALAVSVVSVCVGAFFLARNIPGGGLFNGLILGLVYFIILFALSYIINGSVAFNIHNGTKLLVILASGMLGGIVGINT